MRCDGLVELSNLRFARDLRVEGYFLSLSFTTGQASPTRWARIGSKSRANSSILAQFVQC